MNDPFTRPLDDWQSESTKGRFLAPIGLALILIGAALLLLLSGCTIAPDLNTQGYPVYDSSTPPSYLAATHGGFDSGILPGQATLNGRPMVRLAPNRAKGNAAAVPWTDENGNHIFLIPPDALATPYNAAMDAQRTKLENTR